MELFWDKLTFFIFIFTLFQIGNMLKHLSTFSFHLQPVLTYKKKSYYNTKVKISPVNFGIDIVVTAIRKKNNRKIKIVQKAAEKCIVTNESIVVSHAISHFTQVPNNHNSGTFITQYDCRIQN